jgi:hypothetical protein
MATVRPYPDDAPFIPTKRDDPIPNDLTLRGTPRKSRRRGVRTKIRDPIFTAAVFNLALGKNPLTTKQIARQLHTNPSTVQYILDAGDIEQQRRDSVKRLASRLTDVTDMVLEDTVAKRDRRLGWDIMVGSGVPDAARAALNKPLTDGGRITIEWDGPPPPWAPRHILDAYRSAAPPAGQTPPASEPQKGSGVGTPQSCQQNVIDAEVCDAAGDGDES